MRPFAVSTPVIVSGCRLPATSPPISCQEPSARCQHATPACPLLSHLACARSSGTALSASVIWLASSRITTGKAPAPSHSSPRCSSAAAVAPTTGELRRLRRRCASAPALRAASSALWTESVGWVYFQCNSTGGVRARCASALKGPPPQLALSATISLCFTS